MLSLDALKSLVINGTDWVLYNLLLMSTLANTNWAVRSKLFSAGNNYQPEK